MKIFIVDDSYLMQEFIINILKENRKDKHDTFIKTNNGNEAFETIRSDTVDLILVDWNMPELNGLAFVEKVRGLKKYIDTPIIMISSEQHKDLISQALARGVTDYISKPVNALHLWEKIKKFMD